jgi:hypothetical protein
MKDMVVWKGIIRNDSQKRAGSEGHIRISFVIGERVIYSPDAQDETGNKNDSKNNSGTRYQPGYWLYHAEINSPDIFASKSIHFKQSLLPAGVRRFRVSAGMKRRSGQAFHAVRLRSKSPGRERVWASQRFRPTEESWQLQPHWRHFPGTGNDSPGHWRVSFVCGLGTGLRRNIRKPVVPARSEATIMAIFEL